MLGTRGPQRGLFEADTMYGEYVGRDSFYGFLATHRQELFQDQDFAGMYCRDNGRPSVPPSLLATALVLQTYDKVSDEEAHRRAAFDLQWKVALGVELTAMPFGKSTLCEFRAALLLHQEQAAIFKKSLKLARQRGYLKQQKKLKVALDTTAILGRGAVKDTYNLLADGIALVARVLAAQAGETVADWAEREGYARYVSEPSLKGALSLDWDDKGQRQQALAMIVADAERLLEQVRLARGQLAEGSPEDAAVAKAAELLARVLAQDIERKASEPVLRDGVLRDRMPAIHDPEARHGRKSKANRFVGHKAHLAVDTDSQLITAVAVAPGNSPDAACALELVEQTEANTECPVEETIGDCAYGSGATRQVFEDAGRTLVAKVPAMSNRGCYPKTAFSIDLDAGSCTCPAGQVSTTIRGGRQPYFQFAPAVCGTCPLRPQCVRGRGGRTVQLHPQEALVQRARRLQTSPPFQDYQRRRQVVEHRLARLVQLGTRQARYRGGLKTLFQLLMAAAVANLTLLAGRIHRGLRLLMTHLFRILDSATPAWTLSRSYAPLFGIRLPTPAASYQSLKSAGSRPHS